MVKRGDLVRVETGGGGGWGHPFDREPTASRRRPRWLCFRCERRGRLWRGADPAGTNRIDETPATANRERAPRGKLFHRARYRDVLA